MSKKVYHESVAREDMPMFKKICLKCDFYNPDVYRWGNGECRVFGQLVKADASPLKSGCFKATWFDGPEEESDDDEE